MFFADNLHFVDVTKKIIEKFFKKYLVNSKKCSTFAPGEMAEWSNAAVLKTVDLHGSGGSNPSLSAKSGKESITKVVLFSFIAPTGAKEQRGQNSSVLFLLSGGL